MAALAGLLVHCFGYILLRWKRRTVLEPRYLILFIALMPVALLVVPYPQISNMRGLTLAYVAMPATLAAASLISAFLISSEKSPAV